MAVLISFLSQKGGVGKSTLARALGGVAATAGVSALIADLDPGQHTAERWYREREKLRRTNCLKTLQIARAAQAIEAAQSPAYDLVIVDGPARFDRGTLQLARNSYLVVQPCGASLDDLHPSVLGFHELVRAGIPKERLVIALHRVLSEHEEKRARRYFEKSGYEVLPGSIPEKVGYREAMDCGESLTETKSKTLNAVADKFLTAMLDRLTDEVKARAKSGKGHAA